MENKEVKLSVKNLVISFRTANGKVQAVRNINFDLYKGETLAIVGESGSGKSVTTRAIMGILAANAIKEGGEIVYDGQDLMKIGEDGFHKIRGDKIAMIFQDPLSSLNPIMRIGRQMTEAMLINGKLSQKEARKDFNSTLKRLNINMDAASAAGDKQIAEQNAKKCHNFDKFEYKHLELEGAYDRAKNNATECLYEIDNLLFEIEKNAVTDLPSEVKEILKLAEGSFHKYVVNSRAGELMAAIEKIKQYVKLSLPEAALDFACRIVGKKSRKVMEMKGSDIRDQLTAIREIIAEALEYPMPNFFAMGYYLTFSEEPLPDLSVEELNVFLRKYLDDNFMLDFIASTKSALIKSHEEGLANKQTAVDYINEVMHIFEGDMLKRSEVYKTSGKLIQLITKAIDRLEIHKDNYAYTFASSIKAAISLYYNGIRRNRIEEKRFAKQTAAYERKVAKGKTPDWKVAGKNLVDLDNAKADICTIISKVKENFVNEIAKGDAHDFDAKAVEMIDYLKAKASDVAYKVTRRMAKARALKLMEEVGIPEPKRRYKQYPFEFSGGMRQRIVIAIALSANPDILICDEPTTALDVTIQSQILELINKVKKERQLSVIFITHDLGVVANMADRVAVMYAGKIVEIGTAEDVFYTPAHPYTWALLSSMPDLDTKEKLEAIPGTPPNMIYPPKGDAFAERNKYAMEIDFEEQPPMFKISDTHYAATWLLHPDAPKIEIPKIITDRIERMKNKMGGV